MQVLRDLANESEFKGVVLCSTSYSGIVEEGNMRPYLEAYHRLESLDRRLNRMVASWVQAHLVLVNAGVQTAKTVTRLLFDGEWPKPHFIVVNYDRSVAGDYTMYDHLDQLRRHYRNRILVKASKWTQEKIEEWTEQIAEVEILVDRIVSRGGTVVFVVFPVADMVLSVPERYYPKAEFWDGFARTTKGIAVHFLDVPTLRDFDLPDLSHLDYRDAPRFTGALLDELTRRGVFK